MRIVGWSSPRARDWQRPGGKPAPVRAMRGLAFAVGPLVGNTWQSRLWAAGLFWALAFPLVYEGYAILFRGDPTISRIMSYQLTAHGWYVGLPLAFVLGGICLLLMAHFAGLISIWLP